MDFVDMHGRETNRVLRLWLFLPFAVSSAIICSAFVLALAQSTRLFADALSAFTQEVALGYHFGRSLIERYFRGGDSQVQDEGCEVGN
jgi:hypothetical protein